MIAPIPKPRPRKAEKAEKRREHARATAELREQVMTLHPRDPLYRRLIERHLARHGYPSLDELRKRGRA